MDGRKKKWTKERRERLSEAQRKRWKKTQNVMAKSGRSWGKPEYTKVLVQQFRGKELVEPNKHYSKCLTLYNTNPSEVYEEIIKILKKEKVI